MFGQHEDVESYDSWEQDSLEQINPDAFAIIAES